jgi:uncharacterized membrane protein YeaQ/YmgE (transglycosylase-associated protein family)
MKRPFRRPFILVVIHLNKHCKNFVFIPVICGLVFGCVGPPAGSLAFSIPPMFRDPSPDPVGAVLVAAFFSYVLGIIPAFVTGFVSGAFIRFLQVPVFALFSSIIGALSALLYTVTWKDYSNIFTTPLFWVAFERMAFPGLIGGLFCGVLVGLIHKQMYNYAIKGTSV